jgi:hypothetical protein
MQPQRALVPRLFANTQTHRMPLQLRPPTLLPLRPILTAASKHVKACGCSSYCAASLKHTCPSTESSCAQAKPASTWHTRVVPLRRLRRGSQACPLPPLLPYCALPRHMCICACGGWHAFCSTLCSFLHKHAKRHALVIHPVARDAATTEHQMLSPSTDAVVSLSPMPASRPT